MTIKSTFTTNVTAGKHRGPHLGAIGILFMVLFIAGLSFVISLNGKSPHFPGPDEPAPTLVKYFQNQPHDVLLCGFFQFCSAIALGMFTATVASRMRFLGANTVATNIILFGGFLTAFDVVLTSFNLWVLAFPGIAADDHIARMLYYISFAVGGVGYSVPLGLLIAGISIASLFLKTLPRWVAVTGIVIAFIGELSTLQLLFPKLLPLIPLTRFPGFVWLIIAGFTLPKIIAR